jgi:hypothetical protein
MGSSRSGRLRMRPRTQHSIRRPVIRELQRSSWINRYLKGLKLGLQDQAATKRTLESLRQELGELKMSTFANQSGSSLRLICFHIEVRTSSSSNHPHRECDRGPNSHSQFRCQTGLQSLFGLHRARDQSKALHRQIRLHRCVRFASQFHRLFVLRFEVFCVFYVRQSMHKRKRFQRSALLHRLHQK